MRKRNLNCGESKALVVPFGIGLKNKFYWQPGQSGIYRGVLPAKDAKGTKSKSLFVSFAYFVGNNPFAIRFPFCFASFPRPIK
jgi:hypothetical protein